MENRYNLAESEYVYFRAECFTGKEYLFKTIKCHKTKVGQIVLNFFGNEIQTFHLEKIGGFIILDKASVKDPSPDEKFYKNGGKYMVPLEYHYDNVLIIEGDSNE